ncbi:MAG: 8-amino-7-oxononanoate synthase [Actinomycetota bacterium]|nr:8-amino-7-oxononanoate synthase [Actinomycetota bacterium]
MNVNSDDPLAWLEQKAERRIRAGLQRALAPRAEMMPWVDFASNDYLKLAKDPRVVAGAVAAAEQWGTGATGSRLVTGTIELHSELELALADLTGTPNALVFSSGYLANLAVLTALGGRDCLIIADGGNHASLIDGCKLANARVVTVEHGDLLAAEEALVDRTESRALVVVDAINSVIGDLLPLSSWHEIAHRHGAILIIDDAHGIGVRGQGRGSTWEAGIAAEPDVVVTVTLSKSLGSQGGAVLGDARVIDHVLNTARPFIFDTGLNPPAAGAALVATQIIRQDPALATALLDRSAGIAHALSVAPTDAAIVSWTVGGSQEALDLAEGMSGLGVRVGCFRPPSVAIGSAGLRITANRGHSDGDVELLARSLKQLVTP